MPSIFPFFIATELLGYTKVIYWIGKLFTKFIRPVFNVPGEGAFAFLMGIISGYPISAKIVVSLKEQGICNNAECERLLAFTNNSGPLFIIGTIGISLFNNIKIGILLFITHILACISVGFLFRWWKKGARVSYKDSLRNKKETVSISNLGEILSTSITKATGTVVLIGGFIVLFSVILSILENSNITNLLCMLLTPIFDFFDISKVYANGFICGLIELTNGVENIIFFKDINIFQSILFVSFLLGCGGICILLQIFSITSKANISIKSYIIGKLLQGTFACFYTYIFLTFCNFGIL